MKSTRTIRIERLRWQLVAAVSGISVATACGGRSARDNQNPSESAGGSSGASGGRSGASGAESSGGRSGVGGDATGGTPATGGSGGGSNVPPIGTCSLPESRNDVIACRGRYVHRPTAESCPYPPRDDDDGGGAGGASGSCVTDADCGARGYCVQSVTEEYECVYAGCERDADCGPGRVCSCESFGDAGVIGQCREASCTTDSDCEGGALCISPIDASGCFGGETHAFHCQSLADECWGRDTCGGGQTECVRDVSSDRFVCMDKGACGRPFVVEGAARRASAVSAGDPSWLDARLATASVAAGLSEDERRVVADHFVNAALMEHASIAAFARFSLQLLALGAPASLVEDATRAMADETRHAQMCFALAARYGATATSPGPLAMDGALAETALLEIARLVVVEGCIGETVAALEAAWAADEAADPELRRALETIAGDESRHAALAFRFVAWAAQRDARVATLFERCVAEARRDATRGFEAGTAPGERSVRLVRHGVLDAAVRREARRRALDDVVSRVPFGSGWNGENGAFTASATGRPNPKSSACLRMS